MNERTHTNVCLYIEKCLLTVDLTFSRNVKQKQGVDYTYDTFSDAYLERKSKKKYLFIFSTKIVTQES